MHVAGTLNDATGEQKLFINGVEVASQITAIRPFGPLAPILPGISIGNVQDDFNHELFKGIIDEVRISDVALSPKQFLNASSLSGTVNGMRLKRVVCHNLTTRKVLVIRKQARSWDCEARGLVVRPRHKVRVTLEGRAD